MLAIFLISIAAASASDVNDTAIASEDTGEIDLSANSVETDDLKTSPEDTPLTQTDNGGIISEPYSGTFQALQDKINNATSGDTIKLKNNYTREDNFVDEDGYETYIEQGGTNVSGGQKQRLCIARALLKKPKVLILDDSTSAVDTKTDALIRKGLKDYLPETTKIIIAQRVASIKDADKIIIMENGTINAIGTHKELLKSNEIYKEVYYSQNTKKKKGSDVNE